MNVCGVKLSLRIITSKCASVLIRIFFFPITNVKKNYSGKGWFRSSSSYGGFLGETYFWFQECKEWLGSSVDCSLCPQSVTQESGE